MFAQFYLLFYFPCVFYAFSDLLGSPESAEARAALAEEGAQLVGALLVVLVVLVVVVVVEVVVVVVVREMVVGVVVVEVVVTNI